MNALTQLHTEIDESGWDAADEDAINKAFQNVNDELVKLDDSATLHLSEIERQAFAFTKSPEEKLSFKISGRKTLDDGSEIPFEWPDKNTLSQQDFQYLFRRFNEAKNVFAKTEYGLVLYYSGQIKQNEDVFLLLQSLTELAKSYINKANDEEKHYIVYYRGVLSNALYIAEKRKTNGKIASLYRQLIQFIFDVHQNWDITHKAGLRTIIDLTDFAIQYLKDFKEIINVNAFLNKNWDAAELLADTYIWGAIYVADISIRLCRKLNVSQSNWLNFKAQQYEKLAKESKEQNNMAAVSFIEKAMNIYKELRDKENLHRLQNTYQDLRAEFSLGEVSQEMPEEETQRIIQHIRSVVRNNTEEDLVKTLMLTPMIRPLADIRKWSDESFKSHSLLNTIPTSIQDKFGNTIASYSSDEEKEKFSLIRIYEFHLQIAVQALMQLFIEALRANKISAQTIISFLEQTWLNQGTTRISFGREIAINYMPLINSGLDSFFSELNKWNTQQEYVPNMVSATDSLVLKVEYFLREFAAKIKVPTFKQKPRDSTVIMEKTLDDLINDLEGKLTEDDHYFIKFILTEKAGYNLRNRIAHGLMDNIDYGLEYPVLAIVIILKLSNYLFTADN